MKKILTSMCLLISVPLMANTVYTNESVVHKNFRAFRSLSSCLNWYHIPAQFNVLEGYLPYKQMRRVTVPNVSEKQVGFGFFVDLHIAPPALHTNEEEELKQKIAGYINNVVNRNKSDKKFAHYADCPSFVDAKQVNLNRMLVRNKTDVTTLDSVINSVKPNSVVSINKPGNIDVLSDAYDPVNLNLMYDLSNPETQTIFENTFDGKQNLTLGQSRFMIYGKERIYDASLTLKGELSAQWISELTTVDCKKSQTESNLGLGGALNMPGVQYMPGMGSFGPSAHLSVGEKKEVSVCLQKLLTRMADASSNLRFEFELDRNSNLANKFVTQCENGECQQIPLENWIKITLLDMWVKNNFHVITQRLADNTFEHTVKPTGNTLTKIHNTVSLGENYVMDVDLATPITIAKIKKDYPYANSTSPLLNCLWKNFDLQYYSFELDSKTSLIPVSKACLE